jgi:5-carboxymethyl-2-hydroxymuconate isomerase
MPHLIVDYSPNLSAEELQPEQLLDTLVEAAIGTGLFPESGMRARMFAAQYARVASGEPHYAYINVSMRVGRGRSEEDRKVAGERIFAALQAHAQDLLTHRKVALSFEMRELDNVKFNAKNIP